MNLKRVLHKNIFRSRGAKSLILASVSVCTALIGCLLIWKLISAQNTLYLQKKVDSTAALLGNHFQNKIEQDIAYLLEIGENQLYPKIMGPSTLGSENAGANEGGLNAQGLSSSKSANDSAGTSVPVVDSLLLPHGVLDIAIWEPNDTQGVFNPDLVIKRRYTVYNSNGTALPEDLAQQAYLANETERSLILPAFHDHVVAILAPSTFGKVTSLLLATTLGIRLGAKAVVAHLRLDEFQKFFYKDGLAVASLVDDFGNVIGSTDSVGGAQGTSPAPPLKKKVNESPLFQFMHAAASSTDHMNYYDTNGVRHFGSFLRLSVGNLAILTEISEADATPVFSLMKTQAIFFILFGFLSFFSLGYWVVFAEGSNFFSGKTVPQRIFVTTMHGSLKNYLDLVGAENPGQVTRTLNRFNKLAADLVEHYGGAFERYPDLSFNATWGLLPNSPSSDGTEIWRALRCALHLREETGKWNALRRLDGLVEVITIVGIHSGYGLATQFEDSAPTLLGDVVISTRMIQMMAVKRGMDLLISKDTWNQSEGKFLGESVTQAKISEDITAQPVELFSVLGFRNEEGQAVLTAAPELQTVDTLLPILLSEDTSVAVTTTTNTITSETQIANLTANRKTNRWLVNNGSQILGPLDPAEIAQRLFSQELDFDSECWTEGTGDSAQIKNAGIFSGSDSTDANLWVFDGKTIHGPVTLGFIKTALGHQAISHENYICERSTTQGWKKLADYYNERKSAALLAENSDKAGAPSELASPGPTTNSLINPIGPVTLENPAISVSSGNPPTPPSLPSLPPTAEKTERNDALRSSLTPPALPALPGLPDKKPPT